MFCWRPLKANKFVGCCKLFINIYIRFQVSIFGQAVTYLVYFYNSLAIDIYYFFGKKYHVWFFTSTKIVAKQTCQKSSIAFFFGIKLSVCSVWKWDEKFISFKIVGRQKNNNMVSFFFFWKSSFIHLFPQKLSLSNNVFFWHDGFNKELHNRTVKN